MKIRAAEKAFRNAILYGEAMPPETLPELLEAARRFAEVGDPELAPPPDLAWVDDGTYRDIETNLEIRLRRLAIQAQQQTAYYSELFQGLGINPETFDRQSLPQIPVLKKTVLQSRPYDFVCQDADVLYRTQTSGTGGGTPLGLCFSAQEVALTSYLTAIGSIMSEAVNSSDLFLFPASNRQVLSLTTNALALQMVGVTILWTWLKPPELTLELLSREHRIPNKVPKVSRAIFHASQLGALVTEAVAHGYTPDDFGLKTIIVGGEIATTGLLRRAKQVFGEDVSISESYGISEMWGGGGNVCPARNMHFEPTGIWEFLDPTTLKPAGAEAIATCVGTILPPFRDTMLFMRYDTEDLVRPLEHCPCGEGGSLTTLLQGKKSMSIQHNRGWTTPRDVMEALEDLDEIELPARFGFREEADGVLVEVVADPSARGKIGESLERHNVPLKRLIIRPSEDELERPFILRVDVQ